MIGRTLNHYVIRERLGTGGFGEVYLAEDGRLGRRVALKVLAETARRDPAWRRRIEREARAAAALNHPNIVTLYSVERDGPIDFITMELVEGESLRSRVVPGGLDLDAFRAIAVPLTAAVVAAHAGGVIHRDLKPENVIVRGDGALKVLDFGLARLRQVDDSLASAEMPTTSVAGVFQGTIPYMAPEQLRSEDVDQRCDLFALGVMFYELLCGERPFVGSSPAELAGSILRDAPTPLAVRRPDVPPQLASWVDRCLRRELDDRPPDAATLLAGLSAACDAPPNADRIAASDDDGALAGTGAEARRGVAVLEFANLSGDAEIDWLSGGIAETVGVDLKRAPGIAVLPRDRVRQIFGAARDEDATIEIARRRGIGSLVIGAFQRMGPALRITTRLIDTVEGRVVSSIKTDGALERIFELQDRIVDDLLGALAVELTSARRELIARPATGELEAYECYAKGRMRLLDMTPEAFVEARRLFERATTLDPGYALAWAGRGHLHSMQFIATTDPAELDAAIEALCHAIELDPELGEPAAWLTYAYSRAERFDEAIACGRRAVALEPDYTAAHYMLGVACWLRGAVRYDRASLVESSRHLENAVRAAPRYPAAALLAGYMRLYRGDLAGARPLIESAAALEVADHIELARFYGGHTLLGTLYRRLGEDGEARARWRQALEILDGVNHVYAVAMRSQTACELADLDFDAGAYDECISQLQAVRREIDANARSLGIGRVAVRVRLIMARAFHRLNMRREARAAEDGALDLMATHRGYDFSGVWGANDAELHVEHAVSLVALQRPDEAAAAIGRAVDCAWIDAGHVRRNVHLATLAGHPVFEAAVGRLETSAP